MLTLNRPTTFDRIRCLFFGFVKKRLNVIKSGLISANRSIKVARDVTIRNWMKLAPFELWLAKPKAHARPKW
jgi:hypothetical protein